MRWSGVAPQEARLQRPRETTRDVRAPRCGKETRIATHVSRHRCSCPRWRRCSLLAHFALIEVGREVATLRTPRPDGSWQETRLWIVDDGDAAWLHSAGAAWAKRFEGDPIVEVERAGTIAPLPRDARARPASRASPAAREVRHRRPLGALRRARRRDGARGAVGSAVARPSRDHHDRLLPDRAGDPRAVVAFVRPTRSTSHRRAPRDAQCEGEHPRGAARRHERAARLRLRSCWPPEASTERNASEEFARPREDRGAAAATSCGRIGEVRRRELDLDCRDVPGHRTRMHRSDVSDAVTRCRTNRSCEHAARLGSSNRGKA